MDEETKKLLVKDINSTRNRTPEIAAKDEQYAGVGMKNWQQIRVSWRKQAEKYASKRHPEKCTCFVGAEQCGEWCLWHDEVTRYMKAMEIYDSNG